MPAPRETAGKAPPQARLQKLLPLVGAALALKQSSQPCDRVAMPRLAFQRAAETRFRRRIIAQGRLSHAQIGQRVGVVRAMATVR